MNTLGAVGRHHVSLTQLGCRTRGDIRKLPRGGISRRFDKELLAELDQAYGQRPEAHAWIQIPEDFKARLELMSRVDLGPALLLGARRLLIQMCGWLAARHAGATAFVLRWKHDSMHAKDIADSGELTVRTATPMRDLEHLCRLLAENLAKPLSAQSELCLRDWQPCAAVGEHDAEEPVSGLRSHSCQCLAAAA